MRTLRRLWPLAKRYWFDALLVAGIGCLDRRCGRRPAQQERPGRPAVVRRAGVGRVPRAVLLPAALSLRGAGRGGGTDRRDQLRRLGVDQRRVRGLHRRHHRRLHVRDAEEAEPSRRGWGDSGRGHRDRHHNQGDHPGDFVWPLVVFGVSWIVGFVLGQKFHEGKRRRREQSASSGSAKIRRGSPSLRSGRESRANCTTLSATASAS